MLLDNFTRISKGISKYNLKVVSDYVLKTVLKKYCKNYVYNQVILTSSTYNMKYFILSYPIVPSTNDYNNNLINLSPINVSGKNINIFVHNPTSSCIL